MAMYTNGTRVSYFDPEIKAYPVFCCLHGRVTAVSQDLEQAQKCVELGPVNVMKLIGIPLYLASMTKPEKHLVNEYRRKAGAKFPGAFIF